MPIQHLLKIIFKHYKHKYDPAICVEKYDSYPSSLLKSSIQLMNSIVRLSHEWHWPPTVLHYKIHITTQSFLQQCTAQQNYQCVSNSWYKRCGIPSITNCLVVQSIVDDFPWFASVFLRILTVFWQC